MHVPVTGRAVAGSMSMVRVLPDWALPEVPVHFVTPSRLMPARVRLFGDFLAGRPVQPVIGAAAHDAWSAGDVPALTRILIEY